MVEAYEKVGGNLVAVEEVPNAETPKYGVIAPKARKGNLIEMTGMVEKPKAETAPSNFRIIGRYVLQPSIFRLLETQGAGAGGEIQLTDAMNRLNAAETFHACLCEGVIHDCGSKLGWLTANVDLGLQAPALGDALAAFIRTRMK
jgi:UTP--glucose-1-phosphate uridylyltransferase